MSYLVVVGDGVTGFTRKYQTNATDRVKALMSDEGLPLLVTRRFERNQSAPKAIGLAEGGVLYGSRPTFVWSMPNEEPYAKRFGSSYTAFRIQVLDKDENKLVWMSDVTRAPAQDKEGNFVWRAPLYVGDQTGNAMPIFKSAGNYQWRVAMYNAKFPPAAKISGDTWSEIAEFSVAVGTQQETDDHNYCSVDVAVKYTGPALVLSEAGFVRVQAFETADFSGTPAAQISITDLNSVKDATDIRKNCTLIGLPFGTYYVRAYIDTNRNGVKDDWESWGAAKEPVVVRPNQLAPITGLYIEDADTDQDWLPDAWEVAKYGNLATKGADIDPEGRIVLKREIYEALQTGTANISRFLSGASLTFFQNIGNVSLALGLDDVTEASIAEIRAMVEKNIDPNTVKITSLVVDPGNGTDGKVILTVAAKATDSIAGYLIEPLYELPKSTDVTINIYRKDNLATDQWTFVKAVPKTITTTLEARVEVPIEGVDFNSGFYKVEIVQ